MKIKWPESEPRGEKLNLSKIRRGGPRNFEVAPPPNLDLGTPMWPHTTTNVSNVYWLSCSKANETKIHIASNVNDVETEFLCINCLMEAIHISCSADINISFTF